MTKTTNRALAAHLAPIVDTTFVFCVVARGGSFAPIIHVADEPAAWAKLVSEYRLQGVASIELAPPDCFG
ncbi:hypothetical protein [Caballeronia humi]|nr:hypothetical protein [Caballeronia humi]